MQNQLMCFANMKEETYQGEQVEAKEAVHIITGMSPEEYGKCSVLNITLGEEDFIRPIDRPIKLLFVKKNQQPPDIAPQYMLVSIRDTYEPVISGLKTKAAQMLSCIGKDYFLVVPLRGKHKYSRKIITWGLDITNTYNSRKDRTVSTACLTLAGIVVGGELYVPDYRIILRDFTFRYYCMDFLKDICATKCKDMLMSELDTVLEEQYAN